MTKMQLKKRKKKMNVKYDDKKEFEKKFLHYMGWKNFIPTRKKMKKIAAAFYMDNLIKRMEENND